MTVPVLSILIEAQDVVTSTQWLSFTRGLNFEGGLAGDTAMLVLNNADKAFSVGANKVNVADRLYVTCTYGGTTYALFYGRVARVSLEPVSRTAQVHVDGIGTYWGRNVEVDIAASTTRSLVDFRGLILDAVSVANDQRSLSAWEDEANTPPTEAVKENAWSLLANIDRATLTLSYVQPDPDPDVGFVYTTLPRMARATQAIAETLPDEYVALNVYLDDGRRVTSQRVYALDTSAWYGPSPLTDFDREGEPVQATYVLSYAAAVGVAKYLVIQGQHGDHQFLGDFTVVNQFPSQMVRKLGDRIATTPAWVSDAIDGTIESITTTIDMAALRWTTVYTIGPCINAGEGVFFVINTDELNSALILGY